MVPHPARTVLAAAVGGMLALSFAAPAFAGGKPEHTRIPVPDPAVFPAGLSCEFTVEWRFASQNLQLTTFPVQPDGDQVVRQTGHQVTTITNLDNGRSMTVNTTNRQDFVNHPDGSIDVFIDGRVVAAYFPTDVGGAGMFVFNGHLHDVLDPGFTLVDHHMSGHVLDVCAALS
jgi:hypothetical protein